MAGLRMVSQFLSDHVSDTTSQTIKWEALKCAIRDTLTEKGSRLKKKKERSSDIRKILQEIHTLELRHKHTSDVDSFHQLERKLHMPEAIALASYDYHTPLYNISDPLMVH